MQDDPVVAEIRRIREELAAQFNYDLDAIIEDARKRDAADNRKVIRLPPRRPTTADRQASTKSDRPGIRS